MDDFKVGDKVKLTDYSGYEFPAYEGQTATITETHPELRCEWSDGCTSTLSVSPSVMSRVYLVNNEGNKQVERATYRLIRDTPNCKKGAIVQEKCDDGTQDFIMLNAETHMKHRFENQESVPVVPRGSVEKEPKWFERVYPGTPEWMTQEELDEFAEYKANKAKKPVKKVTKTSTRTAKK